ncbi:MAG: hypothetical protein DBY36_07780 [Clostridiales bacterium]|nr:MAG: hypothetical protein DBY36_07780 [Clostridiales bacterium]
MTDWVTAAISAAIPSVLCGVFMAWFNRKQRCRNDASERRAKAQRDESLLHLELMMATAKLAYATAVALKRGRANGEVEEGVEAYEAARKKYLDFLNRQATEYLS